MEALSLVGEAFLLLGQALTGSKPRPRRSKRVDNLIIRAAGIALRRKLLATQPKCGRWTGDRQDHCQDESPQQRALHRNHAPTLERGAALSQRVLRDAGFVTQGS